MGQAKTHLTAVVAIPPQALWEPIQAIRRLHDRHVRDWMPHVTLLYPFWPAESFDKALEMLRGVEIAGFDATLARFRYFRHYAWSHTIWLDPEPSEAWKRLHAALLGQFPECTESSKYESGFTPHLSVGQSRTEEVAGTFQKSWSPLAWRVTEVALIARRDREPFEVVHTVPLLA